MILQVIASTGWILVDDCGCLHFCNPYFNTNYHLKPFGLIHSLPEKYCAKCMSSWINLFQLFFSYVFNRPNILSFTDFLPQIFTSHGSLRCFQSNQGYYFEFHFYRKSLKTPLHFRDNSTYADLKMYAVTLKWFQISLIRSNRFLN